MLEDTLLVLKLKRGSADALRRIYEKYKDDLLGLAIALANDRAAAEDALHDVFVSFAQYGRNVRLRTSLKSYLSSCIVNRVRNLNQAKANCPQQLDREETIDADCDGPDRLVASAELYRRIDWAMAQLPYPQREVIILHLQGGMRFRAIAESQGVSLNTIQSRYRYGLDKLRSLLKDEVEE
ncbi:MAG: sigma-70 family RNA polymerase sigma factor [Sedimentisphaerales bacterium]|jgi:RNA polymerase sigma-70 factor (ECF subfamily)